MRWIDAKTLHTAKVATKPTLQQHTTGSRDSTRGRPLPNYHRRHRPVPPVRLLLPPPLKGPPERAALHRRDWRKAPLLTTRPQRTGLKPLLPLAAWM